LDEDTVPVRPLAPSTQVEAPRSLSHCELSTTKLPSARPVILRPTVSPMVVNPPSPPPMDGLNTDEIVPVRLLAVVTAPVRPVAPLTQVTAPRPPLQSALATT